MHMFPPKTPAGTVHAGVVGKPLSCTDRLIGSEKRSDESKHYLDVPGS